jgi:Rod binding domain-containing protein
MGGTGSAGLTDADSRQHPRLMDAAQQFEAMMMQEMMKSMQSSENTWDDDSENSDKSMETISSYGAEAVAKAISKSGGLGIARTVVQQVEAEHDLHKKKDVQSTKVFSGGADELK